jgi:GH15 family glucan-1,4-alpha-glucosidase
MKTVQRLLSPKKRHQIPRKSHFQRAFVGATSTFLLFAGVPGGLLARPAEPSPTLEISRPARPWEFLCAVGKRAAIFGNEAGEVEAWVYPLKLFRDFSVTFRTAEGDLKSETMVRTIIARPESTTLVFSGNTFQVKETFFVPVDEPGALIRFDVQTESPLEIIVGLRPDLQLEWPAGLGATYGSWDANLHAFSFGEESKKYVGLVGSPGGTVEAEEFQTNYASSTKDALRLGVTAKGRDTKLVVIAGSVTGAADAEKTYHKLLDHGAELRADSAKYYADYLKRTVNLALPDAQLQAAYDWSRISVLQGLVTNPYLGTGLVAGYRTSGETQRPGFAWFFGRDSLWTSFALNSAGDFATTRQALAFLIQFQRADGKIPHEIAQTASLVDWFKNYPYGFASADATPLFLIAMEDYVRGSGDVAFAKDHWDNLWRAYQFLQSTYDGGFPKNFGVGHGWVEGGPLLPIKSELYQSGLAVEALHSLSELAKWVGKDADAKALAEESAREKARLNEVYWSPEKNSYAFALDQNGKRMDEPSVLATVPMWFGVLDADKSTLMIQQLAAREHATDWGMRIVSNRYANYSAGGYHYGSVWPLFTGWAAVAEYRYHQPNAALQNLRANALLALDGSPGHTTEVLSGDYYQSLATSSPHQIWSAAMVVSPLLRGLLGLQVDAATQTITLALSLPADWSSFGAQNVQAGNAKADFHFTRNPEEIVLEVRRAGSGDCEIAFQPELSLRAEVQSVELNGRPLPFKLEANSSDQHLVTRFKAYGGPSTLRVRMRGDFSVSYTSQLPQLASSSKGLRILSESWSAGHDVLTLELEGSAGASYELAVFNGAQISSVEGGKLAKSPDGAEILNVTLPGGGSAAPVRRTLTIHFGSKSGNVHPKP